jgi:F420-dependent oxidoreductase-like protein
MSQRSADSQPRIGLAITRPSPSAAVEAIVRAEQAGIPAVWSTVAGTSPDGVTILALAAARTQRLELGTSIVPAYPRHPIVLASQALIFADLAPGRFRLGIGPSHRPTIEGMFGIPMTRPLSYMREYLTILRQLLWEGRADVDGEFFHVHAALPQSIEPPRTPILLSALRANAFRQAGEIADGAISWVCPIPYLVQSALPALRAGAEAANRPAPPLIAHVPVALTEDQDRAQTAGRDFLTRYARLPFYARMFADAGYPVAGDGGVSESLVQGLVVAGDGLTVMKRLREIVVEVADEVLVTLLPVGDADALESEFASALAAPATGR